MATTGYAHASQPRALTHGQSRGGLYRDPPVLPPPTRASMMSDKRIVRGNTYSAHHAAPQQLNATKAAPRPRRKARARRDPDPLSSSHLRAETPDAVSGRVHADVQTEHFLEEITDRVVEVDVVTQTDAFMDRPSTPVYVPKKTGVDAEAQVYDGDLFDFDLEVAPLLEILVGKTLEQGLMEVCEEEELANMRAHQEEFIELRNAELAETQRLEEAERRRFEEKERRLRQERERQEKERERKEIAAAREFARTYLNNLESAVFNNLSETGYFHDPVLKEVENSFVPWVEAKLVAHVERAHLARGIADDVLRRSFALREERRRRCVDEMRAEEERERGAKRIAEEERRDRIARERDRVEKERKEKEERRRREKEEKERKNKEEEESEDEEESKPRKKGKGRRKNRD